MSIPDSIPQPLLAAVAFLFAAGFLFGTAGARGAIRSRFRRKKRLGHKGERRARALLRAAGYRIVETQVAATARVRVDGEEESYRVVADALVRRRGRVFVAEIKSGTESATLANRFTRRQLLEYSTVFDVDGVLLVDARRGRVMRVEF